jgi:hypothetical protein
MWMGIVLGAGLLTGCAARMDVAGGEWTKPNTRGPQVSRDEYECVWVAGETVRTPDLVVGGWFDAGRYVVEERQRGRAFERCMTARGYKPAS